MRFLSAFIFLAGIFASVNAPMAQNYICQDKETQEKVNACMLGYFQTQDQKLNGVFKRTIAMLKITDRELGPKRKGAVKRMQQAQEYWVSFRDKNCEAEGFQVRGGRMEPQIYNFCRANLTSTRIKNLEHLLDGNE